jgi:hypothetical protein
MYNFKNKFFELNIDSVFSVRSFGNLKDLFPVIYIIGLCFFILFCFFFKFKEEFFLNGSISYPILSSFLFNSKFMCISNMFQKIIYHPTFFSLFFTPIFSEKAFYLVIFLSPLISCLGLYKFGTIGKLRLFHNMYRNITEEQWGELVNKYVPKLYPDEFETRNLMGENLEVLINKSNALVSDIVAKKEILDRESSGVNRLMDVDQFIAVSKEYDKLNFEYYELENTINEFHQAFVEFDQALFDKLSYRDVIISEFFDSFSPSEWFLLILGLVSISYLTYSIFKNRHSIIENYDQYIEGFF